MVRASIIGVLLLAACGRSPHPGYKRVAEDVHLRFHALGDGGTPVRDGDSLLVRSRAAWLGEPAGSLLSTERWYAAADLRSGALIPVMRRWHEGDSMGIITRAALLPWAVLAPHPMEEMPEDAEVALEVSLLAVRTPEMMRAEEERRRREDPEGFERRLIAAWTARDPGGWERWGTSGLWYRISGGAVDTNRVRAGELVSITYTGRRVEDGRVFDDTQRNGHPLTFRFGDPDQVIKGVETAVHLLREGQQGEFVIPSGMAFGTRGINGVLDPWTPVVYTVRLESVVRN